MANKRRPQGDGTIRKRSDGRWEARIIIGHKNDGSPMYKSAFAKTQKSALKQLHLLLDIGFLRDGSTFCGIANDKPFLDCHLQGFVEHEVDSSDHAVRQLISVQRMGLHSTFLFNLTVKLLNIRCGEGCEWLVTEEAFHLMLYM